MTGTIGLKVPPLSLTEIEEKANKTRDVLGHSGPIKIVKLIEFVLPKVIPQFNFEPVEDAILEGELARTWPDKYFMQMTNSVYEGACAGDGSCNYTLAHELGHLVLHKNIEPSFALAKDKPKYDSFFNSEWQADNFADFFMMPTSDVRATCETIEDIQKRYCVSRGDAERRFKQVFGEPKKGKGQLTLAF